MNRVRIIPLRTLTAREIRYGFGGLVEIAIHRPGDPRDVVAVISRQIPGSKWCVYATGQKPVQRFRLRYEALAFVERTVAEEPMTMTKERW